MYNMRDHVAIAASNSSDGRPVIILHILSRAQFDSELNLAKNKQEKDHRIGRVYCRLRRNKLTWKTVQESNQACEYSRELAHRH